MPQLVESILGQVRLNAVVDIGITALLIYWGFSLIRGTRAVRLVIGVSLVMLIYAAAQFFGLRLLSQIMQTGAVVGLFALVVIFQPELRRALERIGTVGSLAWLFTGTEQRAAGHIAAEVARAAVGISRAGHGALIVLEREIGLQEVAESGVMLHADLSADLLETIFVPRTPLHDGAVIIRGETIVAAAALLPLAETTLQLERFGTRHRAALGITEQSDAIVVVVSEESGQISIVERARIVRNLDEPKLARAIVTLLHPALGGLPFRRGDGTPGGGAPGGRAPRLAELGRVVRRRTHQGRASSTAEGRPAERPPEDQEPPAVAAATRGSR